MKTLVYRLELRFIKDINHLRLVVYVIEDGIETIRDVREFLPDEIEKLRAAWKFNTDLPLYKAQVQWLIDQPEYTLALNC